MHHRLRENRRGGRPVASDVVCLRGDLFGELGAEVLVGVFHLNFPSDGDTVIRDRGGSPLLVDHDVAALGAQGHADGVSERIDAAFEAAAGVLVEFQNLGHVIPCFVG